tara:strand:+ start:1711 stop:2280 length:570 start_codon:yes stop_codon:yes gene_type:complete
MAHYYSPEQDSEFVLKQFDCIINKKEYTFYSAPGVFSGKKLDFGTKVLAQNMKVEKGQRVLDLGCGVGVIARIAFEKGAKVVMTDVNRRAVKLAKMNCRRCKVVCGDMYEKVSGKFDVILLNPPQTAGKKVCLKMIEDAKEHLVKGGSLQVVARHNKGGKTLMLFMEKVYGNIDTLVKSGGYRVYLSEN